MLTDGPGPIYASGECEIDLARRELRVLGSPVPLGARAFGIVEILALSPGDLVTKYDLMDRIWPGAIVNDNALQVHISAIRKALGPHRAMLKTESGRGYRLLGTWTPRDRDPTAVVAPQQLRVIENTPPSNIPAAALGLVGRSTAIQRLRDLVSAYRMVTLTGPGGIGKTALAVEVANNLLGEFEGAAWLVELTSLSDPDLVPTAVASVLGVKLTGEISAESVARAVGAKHLLLVLDNCEHVIDAAANFVERFVSLCPRATVLATSRETLRTNGEHVFRVPPLEVPAAGEEERNQILSHSAVELFIARTKALDSGLLLQAETLSAIGAICRRLDGIPLAIEFAAARAAVLGVQQVAIGLRDRFALLSRGRRMALPRHRTLRAVLDWSHELLTEAERQLLRRLAVFPASFTVDAIAAVMSDSGLDIAAVTDGIASLVAKSLVMLDKSETDARWYLLETTRAYALEKLVKDGEADAVARHHATYYRDFSVANAAAIGSRSLFNIAPYAREIHNVRAALEWSFSAAGDAAIGIALTAAYAPIWLHSALLVECCERCELALFYLDEKPMADARLRLQLEIGFGLAMVYTAARSLDKTRTILASALEIAQNLNDVGACLSAIHGLWLLHHYSGETRAAFSFVDRLSALGSSIADPYILAVVDRLIGNTLHHSGDQPGAQAALERFIARSATSATPQSGFFPQVAQRITSRGYLSRVVLLRGYVDQAGEHARTILEEATAIGSELDICHALREAVCPHALMIGDLAAAEQHIARLIDIASAFNAPIWIGAGHCYEGCLLIAQGAFEAGATLLRSELDAGERTGWKSRYPEFLGVFAEGLAGLGHFDEARVTIDQALAMADRGGERYYVAELLRLKGQFFLDGSGNEHAADIENHFRGALAVAAEQGALLFELRAALAFARWRMRHDRPKEAEQILAPVYGRFTEGFNAADLKAAKGLLDSLR